MPNARIDCQPGVGPNPASSSLARRRVSPLTRSACGSPRSTREILAAACLEPLRPRGGVPAQGRTVTGCLDRAVEAAAAGAGGDPSGGAGAGAAGQGYMLAVTRRDGEVKEE